MGGRDTVRVSSTSVLLLDATGKDAYGEQCYEDGNPFAYANDEGEENSDELYQCVEGVQHYVEQGDNGELYRGCDDCDD